MLALSSPLLWELTVKDLAAGPFLRRWTALGNNQASAATTVSATVFTHDLGDSVVLVTGVQSRIQAGATQVALLARWDLKDDQNNVFARFGGWVPEQVTAATPYEKQTDVNGIVLWPGEHLDVTGEFSAAVNQNNIQGFAWGWVFPRGTLQR